MKSLLFRNNKKVEGSTYGKHAYKLNTIQLSQGFVVEKPITASITLVDRPLYRFSIF